MAAPGSLAARYEAVAGPEGKRLELYYVRVHLGFSIDEWLSLPWWQRRVYAEGMRHDADQRQERADEAGQGDRTGLSGIDAIYGGTIADVAATTKFGASR